MIRDPSDGSVRHEPPTVPVKTGGASAPARSKPAPGPDTGIRQPIRTDAQERLERSREWLRDYRAKKERENARGNDDTEHSTDGRAGDGEGEAES